ncbi:serine/arginine repetitive matrix protein 1-like [Haliotis cracherodii]|uniref:serine/arginine repetitive matrix protein 1-like n=1 Tax=Haliotis cracherodii TaxID=6455 RepID=UPI0039E88228
MADSGGERRPHRRRSPSPERRYRGSPEGPSHRHRSPSRHRSRRTTNSQHQARYGRSPNRRWERPDRLSSRRSSPRSTAGYRSPSPRSPGPRGSSYRSQSQQGPMRSNEDRRHQQPSAESNWYWSVVQADRATVQVNTGTWTHVHAEKQPEASQSVVQAEGDAQSEEGPQEREKRLRGYQLGSAVEQAGERAPFTEEAPTAEVQTEIVTRAPPKRKTQFTVVFSAKTSRGGKAQELIRSRARDFFRDQPAGREEAPDRPPRKISWEGEQWECMEVPDSPPRRKVTWDSPVSLTGKRRIPWGGQNQVSKRACKESVSPPPPGRDSSGGVLQGRSSRQGIRRDHTESRCPLRGCPIKTKKLKRHVVDRHLPWYFKDKEDEKTMQDPETHSRRASALNQLARWILGAEGTFSSWSSMPIDAY